MNLRVTVALLALLTLAATASNSPVIRGGALAFALLAAFALLIGRWLLRPRIERIAEVVHGQAIMPWGREITHEVRVMSRGFFTELSFEATREPDTLPEQQNGSVDAASPRRGEHVYRMTAPCRQRGRWRLGPVFAGVSGLLDPGTRWTLAGTARWILVLPRKVPLTRFALSLDGWDIGDGAGRRRGGDPPDVGGVREYEPGDPLSSIHWPATLHLGGDPLMVNVYESPPPRQVSVYVAVDLDGDDAHMAACEDLVVTIATSLVVYLSGGHRATRRLGLVVSGREPRYIPATWDHGVGARRLQSILAIVGYGNGPEPLLALLQRTMRQARRQRDLVVLVTARSAATRSSLVQSLRSAGIAVRVVQVVAEDTKSAEGAVDDRYGVDTGVGGGEVGAEQTSWPVPALVIPNALADPAQHGTLVAMLEGRASKVSLAGREEGHHG